MAPDPLELDSDGYLVRGAESLVLLILDEVDGTPRHDGLPRMGSLSMERMLSDIGRDFAPSVSIFRQIHPDQDSLRNELAGRAQDPNRELDFHISLSYRPQAAAGALFAQKGTFSAVAGARAPSAAITMGANVRESVRELLERPVGSSIHVAVASALEELAVAVRTAAESGAFKGLPPEVAMQAESLGDVAGRLSALPEPDPAVAGATAGWFVRLCSAVGRKVDLASDEAAKAFGAQWGKWAANASIAGTGIVAADKTGLIDAIAEAAAKVAGAVVREMNP